MTDATQDLEGLRAKALVATPGLAAFYPATVIALLDTIAEQRAEIEAHEKYLDDLVQERIVELGADAEAFDRECINYMRHLLKLCGDGGEETVNHPDGWTADLAYQTIAEELGTLERRAERAKSQLRAATERIAALEAGLREAAENLTEAAEVVRMVRMPQSAAAIDGSVAVISRLLQPGKPA